MSANGISSEGGTSKAASLLSARLGHDSQGNAVSMQYGDVYASRDGAFAQARHVFLQGNGLPERWAGRDQFVILETGFGLGTNFLAAWQAWREDPRRPVRLHFVSVELHPATREDLAKFAPPGCEDLRDQLLRCWPRRLAGVHRLEFEDHRLVLTLAFGDAGRLVSELHAGVDAFFLDGFAPAKNPAMWEPRLFASLARLAREGASAATWSCARPVRDGLAGAGFETGIQAGFGAKREMLVARFAPRWKSRRHEPPVPYAGERRAIVVGAGLAGCAVSLALARRGWKVSLLEAGEDIACGASSLAAGLLHPMPSADHNLTSRIVQAGYLRARSELEALAPNAPGVWRGCGVFQQSQDEADSELLRRWLACLDPPAEHAAWMDASEAEGHIGVRPRRGGIWFAGGGIVSARHWCRAMLAEAGDSVQVHAGMRVESIGEGEARCQDGRTFSAAQVVIAGAMQTPLLSGARALRLRAVRGRITRLQAAPAGMRAGLCGDGYLVPGPSGAMQEGGAVGATFEDPLDVRGSIALTGKQAEAQNLARLAKLLDAPFEAVAVGEFSGERCVSHDRLPLVGAIADEARVGKAAQDLQGAHLADLSRVPGLWCLGGLGTRGLALAALGGELLASMIEGEPRPLEQPAIEALDPARFLLRDLRT